jgi:anti-sigma-K factor RskA
MKDKHITEILDNASIADLSEFELNEVRIHAKDCASCRNAYEAARLSALVIKSRTQVTIEPSPFFQTRVMAALREQQAVDSVPAMFRLWRSARALVSSMAVTTAALAVLSFVLPGPAVADDQTVSAYSVESVVMDQGSDELSYEQVLSAIYAEEDEAN